MTPEAFRLCPDCGAENPLDAQACAECNHPLVLWTRSEPQASSRRAPGFGLLGGRRRAPRPPAGPMLPGQPSVQEEPGKVIPRRRHAQAGLFGIGGGDHRDSAGAPSWIWLLVGGAALVFTLVTAITITTQPRPPEVPGASREQLASADSLATILRRDSLAVRANIAMGNIYYDTQNFREAIPYYRRALAVDPDQIDTRVDLAVALHQTGRSGEGLAELDQVLAKRPDHAVARFDQAVIYEFMGKLDEAEAAYRSLERLPLEPQMRHVVEQRRAEVRRKKAGAVDSMRVTGSSRTSL